MNLLVKELIKPLLEEPNKTIALFPGKFKPPHKGHFEVAKSLLNKADEIKIIISPLPVDGITPQQSKSVWDLYNKLLDNKLDIIIAEQSPVKYVLDTIKNNPNDKFITVFGKGDFDRYKSLTNNPNVFIHDAGTVEELNARDFRKALETNQEITQFLPDDINERDFIKAFSTNIVKENHKYQPTDFKSALASLTKYMLEQGLNISPLPKLKIIDSDSKNASNILGKTAYYDPNNCSITLYTLNRHPKDVLRSYAHEMIHRIQDNEGRLGNINTTNTNEDGALLELEKEAYLNGNIIFRNWEDSIKNQQINLNENLSSHAKNELELAGLFSLESDYGGLIGKAVYELIEKFSNQGHSGFSAAWVRELFNKLSNYENLTPITKNDFIDTSEYSGNGEKLYQSTRNPSIFCTNPDDKSTWYHLDKKTIEEGFKIALLKYKLLNEIQINRHISSN